MNYSKDTFIEGLEVKANEPIFREVEAILIDKLGYDIEMLKVKSNSQGYVYPRMIFSYLCNRRGLGITAIGKKINKDHSTIASYLSKFDSYYKSDKIFKILVDVIVKGEKYGK